MPAEFDELMTRFACELEDAPSSLRLALLAMSSLVYAASLPASDEDALRHARERLIDADQGLTASTTGLGMKQLHKLQRKSVKTMLRLITSSPYGEQLIKVAPAAGSTPNAIRKTICSWLSLLEPAILEANGTSSNDAVSVSNVKVALQALDAGELHPFFKPEKGSKGSRKRRLSIAREQYKAIYLRSQIIEEGVYTDRGVNKFIRLESRGVYTIDRMRKWSKLFDKKLKKKQIRVCEKEIAARIPAMGDRTPALLNELRNALNRLQEYSLKSPKAVH